MKQIFVGLCLLLAVTVRAEILATLDRGSSIHTDVKSSGRIIAISPDHRITELTVDVTKTLVASVTRRELGKLDKVDKVCEPAKLSRAIFADPFYVSVDRICELNISQQALTQVKPDARFSELPNPFTTVYLGSEADTDFFAINGRAFDKPAYLERLALDRRSHSLSTSPLLTNVRGFSGALARDADHVFVATWDDTNQLFSLEIGRALQLAQQNHSVDFKEFFKVEGPTFGGMSTQLFLSDRDYFFFNLEGTHFLINRESNQLTPVQVTKGCVPLSWSKAGWIFNCLPTEADQPATFQLRKELSTLSDIDPIDSHSPKVRS